MEPYNSDIEEIQVHDQTKVTIDEGDGIYPVFFFEGNQVAELNDLLIDVPTTRTIRITRGWTRNIL